MTLAKTSRATRRDFLKLPLATGVAALAARSTGVMATARQSESDHPKVAVMIDLHSSTDDELLYLKQIGVEWVHMDFGRDAPYELIRSTQERLARYGLKIHCAMLDAYRSTRIQLGQPGRGHRKIPDVPPRPGARRYFLHQNRLSPREHVYHAHDRVPARLPGSRV